MRIILSLAGVFLIALIAAPPSFAAGKKSEKQDYTGYPRIEIPQLTSHDALFTAIKEQWNNSDRKPAMAGTYGESDFAKAADMVAFRKQWLACTDADCVEGLLSHGVARSKTDTKDVSASFKFFMAHFEPFLQMRGILWRLRPLFENNAQKGFIGKRSTHVAAVQLIRGAVKNIDTFFPTEQWSAGIEFVSEPSAKMTEADRFDRPWKFQNFLAGDFLKSVVSAEQTLRDVLQKNPGAVYVWDNQMVYGTATAWADDIHRYVAFGPSEGLTGLASMYMLQHNALVFSAFDQEAMLDVAETLGMKIGMRASKYNGIGVYTAAKELLGTEDMIGMTDKERNAIVNDACTKAHFLELRDENGKKWGRFLLGKAYVALTNSVLTTKAAYDSLQGRTANADFALNPIHYQAMSAPHMKRGVENLLNIVQNENQAIRDPITGNSVTVSLKNFYLNPPANFALRALLPTGFDPGQEELARKDNPKLTYRNYRYGSATGWNNTAWSFVVPSAKGAAPGYMKDARRILHFSLGSTLAFNLPDIFVR